MKKSYALLTILLLNTIAYSQDLDYAKSVVRTLASPELKGRGYVENGNLLAADYLSGEYKNIGLEPLEKSFYQKFNIPVNTFPGELSVKINDENLKPGIDFLIESSSPGIKGKFTVVKTERKK